MPPALYAILFAAIALNVLATVRVLRCSFYSARQKSFQVALVWLVPFFGASLVWSLANNEKPRRGSPCGDVGGGDGGGSSFGETNCGEGGCGDAGGGDGGGGGGGD